MGTGEMTGLPNGGATGIGKLSTVVLLRGPRVCCAFKTEFGAIVTALSWNHSGDWLALTFTTFVVVGGDVGDTRSMVSVAPGISPSIHTESMHVHNPELKIGDGREVGGGKTGTGGDGGLIPDTARVVPVYFWVAVMGCPGAIALVKVTQIAPGAVDVVPVPTTLVLAASL
jgi:hypothetical protein